MHTSVAGDGLLVVAQIEGALQIQNFPLLPPVDVTSGFRSDRIISSICKNKQAKNVCFGAGAAIFPSWFFGRSVGAKACWLMVNGYTRKKKKILVQVLFMKSTLSKKRPLWIINFFLKAGAAWSYYFLAWSHSRLILVGAGVGSGTLHFWTLKSHS